MDVLLEHHAGRAVELAHHHALGAVDDERAELGQEGQVTEIDLLLDDVARAALPVLEVLPDDEPERRLQGGRVRHVALDALLHRVLRLTQRGGDVLEGEVLVHVRDREDLPEDPIQAEIPLLFGATSARPASRTTGPGRPAGSASA
jgi:hypothetical protein